MNPLKLVAILLVIGGALGIAYGGFSYTKETHHADIGPVHLAVKDKEHVNIPMWAGVASIVVGGLILASSKRA